MTDVVKIGFDLENPEWKIKAKNKLKLQNKSQLQEQGYISKKRIKSIIWMLAQESLLIIYCFIPFSSF